MVRFSSRNLFVLSCILFRTSPMSDISVAFMSKVFPDLEGGFSVSGVLPPLDLSVRFPVT